MKEPVKGRLIDVRQRCCLAGTGPCDPPLKISFALPNGLCVAMGIFMKYINPNAAQFARTLSACGLRRMYCLVFMLLVYTCEWAFSLSISARALAYWINAHCWAGDPLKSYSQTMPVLLRP